MVWKYIRHQHELDEVLAALPTRFSWAVDTETTGLNAINHKVVLLQIGNTEIQYLIDTRYVNPAPLQPFLESQSFSKVMHNGKFDYKMMKSNFGIETERIRCVYLADKILTNGIKLKGFGLKAMLESYLKIVLDKEEQKSWIDTAYGDYSPQQLEYAANDVKYLLPLNKELSGRLQKDGLDDTYILECNCIPCFGDMELHGVMIDVDQWTTLMNMNFAKAREVESIMNEQFAKQVLPTNMFNEVTMNYGSPDQVVKLMNLLKYKVREWNPTTRTYDEKPIPNSKDETLKKVPDNPFVKMLKQYRGYMIRATTFGQPFIDAIEKKTGRIHPEFHQIGTETGRPATSSDSPVSFLNIPRDLAFRHAVIAPENYLIETDDYSGCELRIWAHLSQDPNLRAPLIAGEDLHCSAATSLFGVPVTKSNENKKLRTPAKTLNFGIIYGMMAKKLYNKLNGEGYPITLDDAYKLYNKYCDHFEVGISYLREAGRFAATEGFAANLNGRRRGFSLPDPRDTEKYPDGADDFKYTGILSSIERAGGNFKVQSVNADLTKYAMVKLRRYIKQNKVRSGIMLQIYDEILTCTHKDDSPDFHEAKIKIMIEAAERWINTVPIEVDGVALPHWTKG